MKPTRIIIDVTGGIAEIVDSEGWPDGLELFIVDFDEDNGGSRIEGKSCTISKIEAGDVASHTGHYAKTVVEEWANG